MSWEEIYTIMKDVDGETYLVILETPITDHPIMFGLTGDEADFAANAMNEVYNQIKKILKAES